MSWESALQSAIEVAIAIAGFSGIVGAVAGRTPGRWSASDQLRLRVLLTASGVALIASFLPFLLVDSFPPERVWRFLSGLLAIYTTSITVYRFRQSRALGLSGSLVFSAVPTLVFQAPVIALMFTNALWLASSAVYVFCVLSGLFIAFSVFVQLLLGATSAAAGADLPAG